MRRRKCILLCETLVCPDVKYERKRWGIVIAGAEAADAAHACLCDGRGGGGTSLKDAAVAAAA